MTDCNLLRLNEFGRGSFPPRREDAVSYDTKDRSLANTVRALRKCMRNLNKHVDPGQDLLYQLSRALVQRYNKRTDSGCADPRHSSIL